MCLDRNKEFLIGVSRHLGREENERKERGKKNKEGRKKKEEGETEKGEMSRRIK